MRHHRCALLHPQLAAKRGVFAFDAAEMFAIERTQHMQSGTTRPPHQVWILLALGAARGSRQPHARGADDTGPASRADETGAHDMRFAARIGAQHLFGARIERQVRDRHSHVRTQFVDFPSRSCQPAEIDTSGPAIDSWRSAKARLGSRNCGPRKITSAMRRMIADLNSCCRERALARSLRLFQSQPGCLRDCTRSFVLSLFTFCRRR